MLHIRRWTLFLAAGILWFASASSAQEPRWCGVIFADDELQQRLEATPIVERPYRPFHFYGNAARRAYYRGTPLPEPRDFVDAINAMFFPQ